MNKYFLRNRITSFFIPLFLALIFLVTTSALVEADWQNKLTDSLPHVFNESNSDLIKSKLRQEAVLKFSTHQLPKTKKEWNTYRADLKNEIIKKTGALIHQKLPLNVKETRSLQMKGYTIENIAFRTRPGIFATANLYIPDST